RRVRALDARYHPGARAMAAAVGPARRRLEHGERRTRVRAEAVRAAFGARLPAGDRPLADERQPVSRRRRPVGARAVAAVQRRAAGLECRPAAEDADDADGYR